MCPLAARLLMTVKSMDLPDEALAESSSARPPVTPAAPARKPGRGTALIAKLGLSAFGLAIALVFAELAIRLLAPQHPSWLDVFAPSSSPAYGLQPNIVRTISTGETHWTIYTDANGFRCSAPNNSAVASAADDRPQLLVLGDSFAFGMAVNYDQSIPGRLASALSDRYHVINAGIPGYGPVQYRQVLDRQLKSNAKIDRVLVATYMGNDFHDCIWTKGTQIRDGVMGNDNSIKSFAKQNSHLYRLVSNSYHRLHEGQRQAWPQEAELFTPSEWSDGRLKSAFEAYGAEFRAMAAACSERKIPLFVCIIPTPQAVESAAAPDHPKLANYDLPVKKAQAIFHELAIPSLDLTPALVQKGVNNAYFSWDQHLNATGDATAADAVVANWPALK
jgi:hypothetical protein